MVIQLQEQQFVLIFGWDWATISKDPEARSPFMMTHRKLSTESENGTSSPENGFP
jgi:hypothetical protein